MSVHVVRHNIEPEGAALYLREWHVEATYSSVTWTPIRDYAYRFASRRAAKTMAARFCGRIVKLIPRKLPKADAACWPFVPNTADEETRLFVCPTAVLSHRDPKPYACAYPRRGCP